MFRFISNISLAIVLSLGLSACGDSDSGNTEAPATPAAPAASAPVADDDDGFDLSTIEKADGVVYRDEIYAGWPYN